MKDFIATFQMWAKKYSLKSGKQKKLLIPPDEYSFYPLLLLKNAPRVTGSKQQHLFCSRIGNLARIRQEQHVSQLGWLGWNCSYFAHSPTSQLYLAVSWGLHWGSGQDTHPLHGSDLLMMAWVPGYVLWGRGPGGSLCISSSPAWEVTPHHSAR